MAKARGFDTVLFDAPSKENNNADIARYRGYAEWTAIEPPAENDLKDVTSVSDVLLAPPVATRDIDFVTVETNLYDVASERRLWPRPDRATV